MSVASSFAVGDDARFRTVAQLWRQRCAEGGDLPAVRYKRDGIWSMLTWREFLQRSRAIGLALAAEGIGRGEVVSILSDNRPEWLIVDMASRALGCISHGVYPDSSAARVARHAIPDHSTRAASGRR